MVDRGGPRKSQPKQSVTGKKSNIHASSRSKGYETEFQLSKGVLTNENPGALAGATEVKNVNKAVKLRGNHSAKRRKSAMSKWAKPAHKAVAKTIGYVLTIGFDSDITADLITILNCRLEPDEQAGLAYAALRSMDPSDAYKVASLALFGVSQGEAVR